jgi:hypothetical protein
MADAGEKHAKLIENQKIKSFPGISIGLQELKKPNDGQ